MKNNKKFIAKRKTPSFDFGGFGDLFMTNLVLWFYDRFDKDS